MRLVWNETKRQENLRRHGFDFDDAQQVFLGITYTMEDSRFAYEERRFVSLGLLEDIVVVIVHTENDEELRVISMRKATRHEQTIYFENI